MPKLLNDEKTDQLRSVDEFGKLGSRLSSVESKLEQLATAIAELPMQINKRHSQSQANPLIPDALHHSRVILDGGSSRDGQHTSGTQSSYVVSGENGEQRHHGASSLLSLLFQSDTTITSSLRNGTSLRDLLLRPNGGQAQQEETPSWDSFFAYKDQVYRDLSRSLTYQSLAPDISSDDIASLLPPKALLESLLEGYFRHIDPVTPLLDRESVLEAIEKSYDDSSQERQAGLGWIVLFNYITIRCLAGRHMLEQPVTDMNVVAGNHFDQPFVVNIRRAFRFLDQLMKPTLVNVQALGALVSNSHTRCMP